MKTIKLKPTDFYHFRSIAFSMGIAFTFLFVNGNYEIQADKKQLKEIGY